jgi:hypothetical protein
MLLKPLDPVEIISAVSKAVSIQAEIVNGAPRHGIA